MKNKAFKILLLVVLAVFAAASLTACSAAKDLVNEMTGKNDIVSVSYIKSVNGIEAQYKAGAVIDYDNASGADVVDTLLDGMSAVGYTV